MSKAFTREDSGGDDDDQDEAPAGLPAGTKNYMRPQSYAALKAERDHLLRTERPRVVEIVSWAAGNGDRSENGDYLYGKKRLREIDRRIRFLTRRIESGVVVDPALQTRHDRVYFGATVTYANSRDQEITVTLVGVDEADMDKGLISWVSPVARALHKASVGDLVQLRTPGGIETLEVIEIAYTDASSQDTKSSVT
jgi:transcription elongation factor GreB